MPSTTDEPVALLAPEEVQLEISHAMRGRAGVTLLGPTTGAGKSRAIRRALADSTDPAVIFVPTHALADSTVADLGRMRARAAAKKGVSQIEDPKTGTPACLDRERADTIAVLGGAPRRDLCMECKYREQHPSGGICPAFAARSRDEPILVMQTVIAPRVLPSLTLQLTASEPSDEPPVRLVVIDEPPPIAMRATATPGDVQAVDTNWDALSPSTRDYLRHPWELLRTALLTGAWLAGSSLRSLLALGGADPADVASALADAASLEEVVWHGAACGRLAKLQKASEIARMATELRRAAGLLDALVEAARRPDDPFAFAGFVVHRARWLREVRAFADAGGTVIIADATACGRTLAAAIGGDVRVVQLHARDAPGVERVWVYWSDAARSRHVDIRRVQGVLRDLAARATARNARRVGIICDKPTSEKLQRLLRGGPCGVPPELRSLVSAGVELVHGHYGALRGLDGWQDCDVLAIIGEDWPNLGDAEASAQLLGQAPLEYARRQLHEELTQAEGRARPVHRPTPVLLVRYTKEAPNYALAPQWGRAPTPQRLARGRPKRLIDADGQSLDHERKRLGISRREHARDLGIPDATYRRRVAAEGHRDGAAPSARRGRAAGP